eukprot:881330-Rhodomonas_salina.2
MAVADFERKDVNLDLIKMEGKTGGQMEDSQLVRTTVTWHYQFGVEPFVHWPQRFWGKRCDSGA